MPRHAAPPRLYLKRGERGRIASWIIKDGAARISTGCSEHDLERAQQALAEYINRKFKAPTGKGANLLIVEVLAAYLQQHAAHASSPKTREFLRDTSRPLLEWWQDKTIVEVKGATCRAYVKWRTSQIYRGRQISDQTARHDLKTLRAALNWYRREIDSEMIVPAVSMPSKTPARSDYWLTRADMAARLKAARRLPQSRHVVRVLLIGYYSGTRPGAILGLRWIPSASNGWIDLEAGVLHRRGRETKITNKRQPPAKIHVRLLQHLRRWHRRDAVRGVTHVVHYEGAPILKLRRSWATVARAAGAKGPDGPHILRHSCCTWLMQAGVSVYEVSGYTGMSVEVLLDVYGHHHPDFQSKAATATGRQG